MAELRVTINPQGAVAGAAVAGKSLDTIRRKSRRALTGVRGLEGGFNSFKRTLFDLRSVIAGFTFATIFRGAITTAAEFEANMAAIESVTRATIFEMEQMEKTARRLGATTVFTASQSAEGMKLFGQAGFETKEILDTIPGALDLAVATSADLVTASRIMVTAVRAFGLETEEAGRAADVFALATASAATDIYDLTDAIKFVAPAAAAAGVSIEETTAAIGILSNAGFRGTLAGTALRRVFAELSKEDIGDKLRAIGADIDSSTLATEGLVATFQKLRDAGLNLPVAIEVFNLRGGPAALVLAALSDELAKMKDKLDNAGDSAREMAEIRLNTLQGATKEFTSALQESVLVLVSDSGLLGGITDVMRAMTGVIRVWVGLGDTVDKNREQILKLASALELVAKAFALIIAVRISRYFGTVATQAGIATLAWTRYNAAILSGNAILLNSARAQQLRTAHLATEAQASAAATAAQLRLSISRATATTATVAQSGALAAVSAAHVANVAAQRRATAATTAAATAASRMAVASRAAAFGVGLLRRSMALLGGPVGILLLAAQAMFLLRGREEDLVDETDDLISKMKSLGDQTRSVFSETLGAAAEEGRAGVQQIREELSTVSTELAAVIKAKEKLEETPTVEARAATPGQAAIAQDIARAVAISQLENRIEDLLKKQNELVDNLRSLSDATSVVTQRTVEQQRVEEETARLKAELNKLLEEGGFLTERELDIKDRITEQLRELRSETNQLNGVYGDTEAETISFAASLGILASDMAVLADGTVILSGRLNELNEAFKENREARELQGVIGDLQTEEEAISEQAGILAQGLSSGRLSAEEFEEAMLRLNEQFMKSQDDMAGVTEISGFLRDSMSSIFREAASGGMEFDQVLRQLGISLLELVFELTVIKPLIEAFTTSFNNMGGFGGIFGSIGDLLSFQHGGSFVVPGAGAPDSRLAAFRVSPGERVTVTPPNRSTVSEGVVVNVNVENQGGAEMEVRDTQRHGHQVNIRAVIRGVVADDLARNRGPIPKAIDSRRRIRR